MVSTHTPHRTVRAYITNAVLVLPDQVIPSGSLLIAEGCIAAICPTSVHGPCERFDLGGDLLLPGLIDIHGDAVEREMEPRDRAMLPLLHAVVQGDRKCALAGITTPFHALAFAGQKHGRRNNERLVELARLMHDRAHRSLVDNRVHCRFEMTSAIGIEPIEQLIHEGICRMISLNNHAPGQGQFADLDVYRRYLKGNYQMPDAEIDRLIREAETSSCDAENFGQEMAEIALNASIPLASHDDEDEQKVRKRYAQGARITEFPLSIGAARAATELQMHAIVGSPNVLRGGSTGTGESALTLIGKGLATCLCSDYAPSTLLPAAFKIASELDWPLHRAVALATLNPARACNLSDRGAIAPGNRADLVAVNDAAGAPTVTHVWSQGRLVLSFN